MELTPQKKKILIVTAIGIFGIVVIAILLRRKTKGEKKEEHSKPIDVSNSSTPPTNLTAEKVQTDSRPYLHITKRIADLSSILNDIENKGNDKLWYKKENRELGEQIKNTLWLTGYRNLKSLRGGLQTDASINKVTKDYLLSKLTEYENYSKTIFDITKYNDSKKWVQDTLKNINDPVNYFYD